MKRMTALFLILFLFLSGCSVGGERIKDPVTFYYIRGDYREDMDQAIASEVREASGHRNDLSYLLALYLMGPSKEELVSPLPKGTRIHLSGETESEIILKLSEGVHTMTDAEFTLASACLGLTCLELSETDQVTVVYEDRSITVNAEGLILLSDDMLMQMEGTK